jgi:hypothetical protein
LNEDRFARWLADIVQDDDLCERNRLWFWRGRLIGSLLARADLLRRVEAYALPGIIGAVGSWLQSVARREPDMVSGAIIGGPDGSSELGSRRGGRG